MAIKGCNGIVTGGSSGIGRAIAHVLASEGVDLTIVGRRAELLESLKAELVTFGVRVTCLNLDLLSERAVDEVVDAHLSEFGSVNVVVNSAGSAVSLQKVHELDVARWKREVDLNLTVPMMFCRRVLPYMRRDQKGFIVNICSEAGVEVYPGMGGYAVSKHGLRVLTELIHRENSTLGIKAWAICPGEVATEMADWDNGDPSTFLSVSDISDLVRFLLSQGSEVAMGPTVLVRTMKPPFVGSSREFDASLPD